MLSIPITPAMASGPVVVNISSANLSTTDLGGSFSTSTTASNAPNLVAYDCILGYNHDVFMVSASQDPAQGGNPMSGLTGTSFDPATASVFVAKAEVFQAAGFIRYAVILTSGTLNLASASLFNIGFQVSSTGGATASDYNNGAVSIPTPACTLVGENPGIGPIPSTSGPGLSWSPPSDLALQSVGCRSANDGFNTRSKGLTDPLFCRASNSGGQAITATAVYSYRSVGGVTGSVSSGTMSLAPGQFGGDSGFPAGLTVPNNNDIFIVTGQVSRVITFPDSSTLTVGGPSDTFKVVVNT